MRLQRIIDPRACRRCLLAVFALLAAIATGSSPAHAQSYPTQPIRMVVPFAAGGLNRRGGATGCATSRAIARPAGDHRQPAGRERHRRHRRDRQGDARRLHAADGGIELHGDPGHRIEGAVRRRSAISRRSSMVAKNSLLFLVNPEGAGEVAGRIRRARQGRAGQVQLRLAGRRHPDPSRGRAVQPEGRHQACSTSRIAAARRR